MRTPPTTAMHAAVLLLSTAMLGACASSADGPRPMPAGNEAFVVPDGAVEDIRTETNGDKVYEYRVQGQLRMVKVVPLRGPTYYLVDRNGDGKVNPEDGEAPAVYYKLFSW